MTYELLRPQWLWVLLIIPPLLVFGVLRLRRLSLVRRFAIMLFQGLSMVALIVALALPARAIPDNGMSLVVVLDASASLSAASRSQAQAYAQSVLDSAGPNDNVQFVAFDSQARVLSKQEVTGGVWAGSAQGTAAATQPSGTITPAATATATAAPEPAASSLAENSDIAAGLRLANNLLRDEGRRRIVLVSDGWQTQGDAAAEAGNLTARGIDLEVVALPALGDPEVVVKYLATPSYTRVGDTITSNLSVYSSQPISATLSISVDGGTPSKQLIDLAAGGNGIPINQTAQSEGYHSINVSVVPGSDSNSANNSASAATVVKPQPNVLVLETRTGESTPLVAALQSRQIKVTVQNANTVPAQVSGLDAYDSIVLDDVAATNLTLDQQQTLEQFVRRAGKGLVVVGGSTAYGKGGYADSVFEQMLPVSSKPQPRPEHDTTALILVIDRSFSMTEDEDADGNNRLTMARTAASLAVDALHAGDYLGVETFDTENNWDVPFAALTGDAAKQLAKDEIARISPGGATKFYSALVEADAAMQKVDAPSKHIVLLTDGREASLSDKYDSLLAQIRSDNVSLSTVGIGTGVDKDFLTNLATQGNGRSYFTENINNIPQIVFKELNQALTEFIVQGQVTSEIAAPSSVLNGFRPQDFPLLGGYDITTAKDDAVVPLTSNKGDPLLAQWQYGLGRVVAYTSDASTDWASQWLQWSDFARFWSQAVRWSLPSPVSPLLQPSVSVTSQDGTPTAQITVESLNSDNTFADLQDVSASLRAPSGAVTGTLLLQTAPGRYAASMPLSENGAYEVRLQRGSGSDAATETIGFAVPPNPELLNPGINDPLLQQIANDKNYQTTAEQALDPTALQGRASDAQPLWAYLLAPALLFLFLSVAARRLDFRFWRRT